MRTTLDIDEDVLEAAKELAAARKTSIGKVVSELARTALKPNTGRATVRNGIPLLPPRRGERRVTTATVAKLRDEESS